MRSLSAPFVMLFWLALAGASDQPVTQGFDLRVPRAPEAVWTGERQRLTYELHLWNVAARPFNLGRIDILDDASGERLASFGGADLEARLRDGTGEPLAQSMVPPAGHVVAYLEIDLVPGAVPRALRHRIDYLASETQRQVAGAVTPVRAAPLPVLGPPLRGGPWAAVYDPSLDNGHRRFFYAVDGTARIPGRFAIDWMRAMGPGSAPPEGDGAEVLAVADGVIAAARDGFPEPGAGEEAPDAGPGDATGNYIALDIGGGRLVFYEHLKPGLLVRAGMRVRRGQVVARLGRTGQADRPHLHFHLADANSPLGAEGQPYLLRGATRIGAYASFDAFIQNQPWRPMRAGPARATFPEPNVVVTFPER